MPTTRIEGRTAVFADWAWQALLVTGVCSVALGLVLLAWPGKTETVAGTLSALVLLSSAAVQWIVAFGTRISTPLKVLEFGSGTVALLLGLWCFDSGQWVLLLALWIGMGWMIRGVVQAIVGAWSEEFAGAGRQEVVGLCTTVMGIVVAVVPFGSMMALALAVGPYLILLGISEILTAARVDRGAVQAIPEGGPSALWN
ncbi:HdeD family acid-resistance protein [Nocardia sp. IFM 10818]